MSLKPADIEVLRAELRKSVYVYSVEKNLRRYNKWMPRLELFGIVLSNAKVEDWHAFQEDLGRFKDMHTFLEADPTAHAALPEVWKALNDITGGLSVRIAQWMVLVERTKPGDWLPLFGLLES